ncbi:hypothetical protein JCM14076_25110 [Methylosoma difficile]
MMIDEPSSASNAKNIALGKFRSSFFSTAPKPQPAYTVREEQVSEAFYYFFSNQFEKISKQHSHAVKKYFPHPFTAWLKPPQFPAQTTLLSPEQALNFPSLAHCRPYLGQLLDHCLSEQLPVSLVESAAQQQLSLPSPYSAGLAYCNESYEVGLGINCLRFTDAQQSFFLIQRISSADGLYFPMENLAICFCYFQIKHIHQLQQHLIKHFSEAINYASTPNKFAGIIASHVRPAHFFYDIWPAILKIYNKPFVFNQIEKIITRRNQDYLDLNVVLGTEKASIQDSPQINKAVLSQHQILIHVGVHRNNYPHFHHYESADQFLVERAIRSPSSKASALEEKILHSYPIVWIGVEGQKRCWLEQVEGYAYILNNLSQRYPKLAVIFDGWTLPLTASAKSIKEAQKDSLIAEKIIKQLTTTITHISVIGCDSHTKLLIGKHLHFFITNYTSGSLHVSRLLGKPGFCHASNQLTELSLKNADQLHPNNQVYLVPKNLVQDKNEENIIRHRRTEPLNASSKPGSTSYSINKRDFYHFIETKLAKVLEDQAPPQQRIFMETPWSIDESFRDHLKMATNGKCITVYPSHAIKSLNDLADFGSDYLRRHIIYGNFAFGCHHQLHIQQAQYLIWLAEPIKRTYLNIIQLQKIAENKGKFCNLEAIIDEGHPCLDNFYTRRISGMDPPFGECSEAMLNKAIEHLKNHFIFIGIDEKHDCSIRHLAAILDVDPSLFTEKPLSVSEIDINASHLKIYNLNIFDLQLYNTAVSFFK